MDTPVGSTPSDLIMIELLRMVQQLDTKLTSYDLEQAEHIARLDRIENRMEAICEQLSKPWYKRIFSKA